MTVSFLHNLQQLLTHFTAHLIHSSQTGFILLLFSIPLRANRAVVCHWRGTMNEMFGSAVCNNFTKLEY